MKVRIITDDFTSASDGLVGFARMGGGASAVLDWRDPGALAIAAEAATALGVHTDSRSCPPVEAASRVSAWARRWAGADVLLKQFDSTLRGPVAEECIAAWRASRRPRMLVVPAFPAAGRSTRRGEVLVDGVPVHRTDFSKDPSTPVRESSIVRLFAGAGVPLQVAADAAHAQALFAGGHGAVCVDVATEDALAEVARCFVNDRHVLWAGSTGIARALARVARDAVPPVSSPPGGAHPPCKAPLVLLGSRHPVSRMQAARLSLDRPSVRLLTMPVEGTGLQMAQAALHALAAEAAGAVRLGHCDAVVATGGDMADALAKALGAARMDVLREVEPGIPLNMLHLAGASLPLVTKAGGFGHERTLHVCLDLLTGAAP